MTPVLDDQDIRIMYERRDSIEMIEGPRVGDFVEFADGITRRVSYVWEADGLPDVQTSDGGSFYLGHGYVSFSGSLYNAVRRDTLTDTGVRRPGSAWFFHHDWHIRDNGVDVTIPFRVYRCAENAPAS